jgi:hypothetical protein
MIFKLKQKNKRELIYLFSNPADIYAFFEFIIELCTENVACVVTRALVFYVPKTN